MKICWGAISIPEMADLPPAERRRLWKAATKRACRHWQTCMAFLFAALVLAVTAPIPMFVIPDDAAYEAFLYCVFISGLPLGVAACIYQQVLIRMARPYMRTLRGAGNA